MNGPLPEPMGVEALDFTRLLRPGDGIVFGQACAEAMSLTERLVQQARDIAAAHGRTTVFAGGSYSGLFTPALASHFDFTSYGALGGGAALAAAGKLEIVPSHYSQLPWLLASGRVKCDVVLLQLADADPSGRHSLGVANDFLLGAARRARVVIAEVNTRAPWTHGAELPDDLRIDHVIRSDRELVRIATEAPDATAARIAANVAALVPAGATVQMGIGSLVRAICEALQGHRELRAHAGIIGDGIADLMEAGIVVEARTGALFGTERLFRFAHRNPLVRVVGTDETHGHAALARLKAFCAINSAIEVDLTGQVNAEVARGAYVGAVGGQVDFNRAAAMSEGGLSVIALASTARGGTVSRIVPALTGVPVTTPRSDVDCIVTEWGCAHLKGLSLRARAAAMARVAHPDFRDALAHAARDVC